MAVATRSAVAGLVMEGEAPAPLLALDSVLPFCLGELDSLLRLSDLGMRAIFFSKNCMNRLRFFSMALHGCSTLTMKSSSFISSGL